MPLTLAKATPSDAPRMADIHMAAFGQNNMLLAQFPTEKVRQGLWISLVDKAVAEMSDPQWKVLVVKDETGEIISFAKWCLPIPEGVEYEESPWHWPEGFNSTVLDAWTAKLKMRRVGFLGRSLVIVWLTFIATDPKHERRGAASLLVKWGIEHSRKENVPIALEGTMNAVPFYERLGFKSEAYISLPLQGLRKDGEEILYEEICLVFRPNLASL